MLEVIHSFGTESCLACGATPTVATSGAVNLQFCGTCLEAIPRAPSAVPGLAPWVETAWALGPRGGALGGLVAASRTGGDEAVIWALARQCAWNAPLPEVDAVAAVPSSPRRRQIRGLNPADVVGCAVASVLGLPFLRPLMSRRIDAHAGGHAILGCADTPGRVLLVADVLPPRETLAFCAQGLREVGADQVHLLVLAADAVPEGTSEEPLPARPFNPTRNARVWSRRGADRRRPLGVPGVPPG